MSCRPFPENALISLKSITITVILILFSVNLFPDNATSAQHRGVHKKAKAIHVPSMKIITIANTARVKIPRNFHVPQPDKRLYRSHDFTVTLYSKRFAQGNAAYIEIIPVKSEGFPVDVDIKADLEGEKILLTRMVWGYRGVFALPTDISPGEKTLTVKTIAADNEITYTYPLTVRWTWFPVYRGSMDLGKYSDRDYLKNNPELVKMIQDNFAKRAEALSRISEDMLTSRMSHPRDFHKITSAFNAKRITGRYVMRGRRKIMKKPSVNRHSGVDLKGKDSNPIYALASGKVVIAENMYYEGNHTMIDHGNGIITRYMHQSKILVSPGQYVKGGQLIGYCGKTGMVTGPHLHIGLYIRGEYVDPLSLLSLPVRK